MEVSQPLAPTPCVCIIIAAYNSQATIERAIKSALAEPEVAEVVVVDDASTDNTALTARSLEDGTNRLKILVQSKNAGPSSARNRAMAESKAPWIGILDADDFFLPGRIRNLLACSKDADMIADNMWQVPEQDVNGPRKSLLGSVVSGEQTISFERFVSSNVTRRGRDRAELGFIKPLIRRSFLQSHGITYQEHIRLGEDYELYARALGMGAKLLLIPTPGYVSVVRANSLSGQHSETDLLHLRECDHQLLADLTLTPAERQALRSHYLSIDCRLQWRLLILAVKNRNLSAAFRTFLRPFPVPFYLAHQLWLQFCLRYLNKTTKSS